MKNEKINEILQFIKKVFGFLIDVIKVGGRYLGRKISELFKKYVHRDKIKKALKKAVSSVKRKFAKLTKKAPADDDTEQSEPLLEETETPEEKGLRPSISVTVIAAAAVFIVLFLFINARMTSHFLHGTTINGVDVSGMSIKEAQRAIVDACGDYELVLLEKNGVTETIKASDIALEAEVSDDFKNVLKARSGYSWFEALYGASEPNTNGVITYKYDDALFASVISSLECVSPKTVTQPVDAGLYYQDGEFKIRPAISGNAADPAVVAQGVRDAISRQDKTLDLEAQGIYPMPDVRTDDPELTAKINAFSNLTGIDVTLKFGDKSEHITPETAADWYVAEDKGDGYVVRFDENKYEDYIANIANTYNTISQPKQFVTHYGETVTLSNSYYGWQLDTDYAATALREIVDKHESVTVDLTDKSEESNKWWMKTAAAYSDTGYYGNTYAEVSIDGQYMWMYVDGEVALESDVVTGMPDSEHDTPVGIYSIIYKEENATLTGEDYETVVAYWMVFTVDIGFHDADWQYAFGGDMYYDNGSHGCVNLPVDVAGELYELVYPGMPVFVY